MLSHPLNAALYHAGDIGRARAAACVLRIFRDSSSRKPDDEVVVPPTQRLNSEVSRRAPFRERLQASFKSTDFLVVLRLATAKSHNTDII